MKMFGALAVSAMMAVFVGCGPVDDQSSMEGAPSMVEATLNNEVPVPDAAMIDALEAACESPSWDECVNAGFGSCTAWSAFVDCGSPSACDDFSPQCKERIGGEWFTTGTVFQGRNSYRVCLNAVGASCTEYRLEQVVQSCGCGGGIPL
ncbi:hypothetical protein HV824_35195 [Myxococcus sp. AM009]|uniref:hypothetical protein n=1 Tax=unclassified Myxococcus TaxID=2648731 RepID=UPI001595185E|nr:MULTISPECIES: hypothetical protein [unclassified Myxococcus]NVJ03324.1 hypothetical protein [Myxococcus sp. AM009]